MTGRGTLLLFALAVALCALAVPAAGNRVAVCTAGSVCVTPAAGAQSVPLRVRAPTCSGVASITFRDPSDGSTVTVSAARVGGGAPSCDYSLLAPYQFCVRARQASQGGGGTVHVLEVYLAGAPRSKATFTLRCGVAKLVATLKAFPSVVEEGNPITLVLDVSELSADGTVMPGAHLPIDFATTFGTLKTARAVTAKGGRVLDQLDSPTDGRALVTASYNGQELAQVGAQFLPKWKCDRSSGSRVVIFDNGNGAPVDNGGAAPTFSTNGHAYCLAYVQTYHWNDGRGFLPDEITIRAVKIDPDRPPGLKPLFAQVTLKAKGSPGQDDVPNANWYAYDDGDLHGHPAFMDGVYVCVDSYPATWSSNKESGGQGFCRVEGWPAVKY